MHLADGLLPLSHAAAWATVATPFVVEAAWASRRAEDTQSRALARLGGALLFAVTLFPVPVPLVGVTSHMCATPVLALLLGRRRVVLPTLGCLVLQALFFAHGGLTTLGANVLTLGVVGPAVALGVARVLQRLRVPGGVSLFLSCTLADVAVYVADAALLGLALQGEQPFSHWFSVALLGLAPAQVPLALLEGALSVALVRALARRRPEIVPAWLGLPPLMPRAATLAAVALLALAPVSARAEPGSWQGLDEAVLAATAERAGRPPSSLVPELPEELLLFVFSLGSFLAGVQVGRAWTQLSQRRGPREPREPHVPHA
jgi:cobalt/nickel transport system permease protein